MAKEKKQPKQRSYGVRDIMNWKFAESNLPEVWLNHLGDIPERFTMYVDGDGGHGKTEYVIQLAKMLCNHFAKTHLNNVEQGKHKQIGKSVARNKFDTEVPAGKFIYSSITDFEKYKARIKRPNSGRVQIIDSISYWPLNQKQIQELIEEFKYKSFVFVAYKAHFTKNRPIAHLCDIKVRIEDFKAYPSGRFGGNRIYDKIYPNREADLLGITPTPDPFAEQTRHLEPMELDEEQAGNGEAVQVNDDLPPVKDGDDYEPDDGCFRGNEAASFEAERMHAIQRDLK